MRMIEQQGPTIFDHKNDRCPRCGDTGFVLEQKGNPGMPGPSEVMEVRCPECLKPPNGESTEASRE
jgi:endogenous inhibitor of DNA gyrase (YacG/DUF329 family)